MEVNQETITHLAELSSFALGEQERTQLAADLNKIIEYISQLDQLDVSGIEPTYQVFEMENVWRDDEILPQEADREQLLALTKQVEDHQIKVPKIL